jgi:hypothetical protein
MRRILALVVLAANLAGCATDEPDEPVTFGDGFGTADNPIPQEDPYAVRSTIKLGLDASAVSATVADLTAFTTSPAKTLLARANSTAVQALLASLTPALRDRLNGWIDTEIDKARVGGKTVRQFATDMATTTNVALTEMVVESRLSISPTGATHDLTGLNIRPLGLDIIIPVGGLKADTLAQKTTATVGVGGTLALGAQQFALALGPHAWQGINLASESLYGDTIETALTHGLPCATIASAVAARSYSGVYVGHATEIQALCEAGRAAIVDALSTHVGAFTLPGLHFASGAARLADDNRNGVADRLVDGTWQAEVDTGTGMRPVSATFIALDGF